jgi:hypothetical protein
MSPSELFLKIASPPVVLAAAFVFVVASALFVMFNPTRAIEARFKDALNGDIFFRTNLSAYLPHKLYAMLDAYTEADYRDHYKFLYLDFVYALIYAVVLGLAIVALQNQFRPPNATINSYPVLIPFGAALANYLEDTCLYLILRRYETGRRQARALAVFAASMTVVKNLLFIASLLMIVAGLLKLTLE